MKSKRVLIVDDNDLNRKLFENLLGQIYQIDTANNGLQALEKIEKHPFDLVLMDIQMPTLDGISTMKRIRRGQQSDTLIVAITAFADESDRDSFIEMGFDDFLTKPIRPREFLDAIKQIIDHEQGKISTIEIESYSEKTLNTETILQLMKYNSKEAMKSVLDDFIQDCDQIVLDIRNKIDWDTIEEITLAIHSLKGNAGTLGAEKIFKAALDCETLARRKMIIELKESLPNLEHSINEFKNYYTNFNLDK